MDELTGQTPRILKSDKMLTSLYVDLWTTYQCRAGMVWRTAELQKNGELHWDYRAISPVFDVDGKITHYVSIQEDITQRKLMEEKLQQQMQFSDGIINNLPGTYYMLDKEGRFVRENPQLLAVTGYSKAELDHMTALDLFMGEDKKLFSQRIHEAFEKGDV